VTIRSNTDRMLQHTGLWRALQPSVGLAIDILGA
jgi:hypothetical protein